MDSAPHYRPRRMPFWSLLDDDARAQLLAMGSMVTFLPKDTMLRQYDLTDHLLVIRRGCARWPPAPPAAIRPCSPSAGPGSCWASRPPWTADRAPPRSAR
ncbi:hypothetical protein NKH18_24150 [Streptomyces sp. M10(2022)]